MDKVSLVSDVKAILERLRFHASEDVSIWSNVEADRGLDRCLKKVVKEFEDDKLVLSSGYPLLKHIESDTLLNTLTSALSASQEEKKPLLVKVDHLQAEFEQLKSEPAKWVPCSESAPTIENTDVQAKVWFFDGTSVRRVPYYILRGCNEYKGTQEYKYGYWMAIPRPIKPKPPVKAKEQAND